MVELFLDGGIDPNESRQPDRLTPLFFAHQRPYDKAELLLARGANIAARDKHGRTVLHHAVILNDAGWLKFLLEHGADPEAQTKSRETPWMHAVRWKRPQAAKLLVEFAKTMHSS